MQRLVNKDTLLPSASSVGVLGKRVRPFLVADSAFALNPTLMKCHDDNGHLSPRQSAFNYCCIRTRRVVENAIGQLKGRWGILIHNFIRDPVFARRIALAAAVLHNVCERCQCPFEETWIPEECCVPGDPQVPADNDSTADIRSLLARYVETRIPPRQ